MLSNAKDITLKNTLNKNNLKMYEEKKPGASNEEKLKSGTCLSFGRKLHAPFSHCSASAR